MLIVVDRCYIDVSEAQAGVVVVVVEISCVNTNWFFTGSLIKISERFLRKESFAVFCFASLR